MGSEVSRHRSTANTAKLLSGIILLASFMLLLAGIVLVLTTLSPEGAAHLQNQLPSDLGVQINLSFILGSKLLGLSILFAWMGYLLRVMSCLLESQLPDKLQNRKN